MPDKATVEAMSSRREAWPHPPFHGTQQENFQKNFPRLGFADFFGSCGFSANKETQFDLREQELSQWKRMARKNLVDTSIAASEACKKSCRITQNAKSTTGQDRVNFDKHYGVYGVYTLED